MFKLIDLPDHNISSIVKRLFNVICYCEGLRVFVLYNVETMNVLYSLCYVRSVVVMSVTITA